MNPELIVILVMLAPLLGAVGIGIASRHPNRRETVTILTSLIMFTLVVLLIDPVVSGEPPEVIVATLFPGLSILFRLEPLGLLFALIASGLWILNSIYSIGYMRGNNEAHQTRFYICFALSLFAVMGIAFAGNMLTLFLFYELLTLVTFPLVTHKGSDEAYKSGKLYLSILLGTSIGFLLLAMIWTWAVSGTLEFTKGGVLAGNVSDGFAPVLLALYMFGIGKAALMPFHRWLPAAMVAPTPVSALLHAVAVVKAGVFTVLKVVIYIFGIDFLTQTGASTWLAWIASFTLLAASIIALRKDNLKARLAYSTISQLAYVVLGAALATAASLTGSALQIAMHAMGKITLFFCAGAIYTAVRYTQVSQLNGLGKRMPFTFAAFFIASLSIIGLPPTGGAWAKWSLLLGAIESEQIIFVFVLLASSLLSIAYLLPIVVKGFLYRPTAAQDESKIQEAPLACVIPLCITALGCIVLFFAGNSIWQLLNPVFQP